MSGRLYLYIFLEVFRFETCLDCSSNNNNNYISIVCRNYKIRKSSINNWSLFKTEFNVAALQA